ncbi:MAG: carbonic anhydrase family protein [Candidatus Accumulibacter sp.]|jgi:carbonic anhydrase|nr:carbonic anhydrase family protein [Accumulibacter sp.]
MKSFSIRALAFCTCVLVFDAGAVEEQAYGTHWSYHGGTGPAYWGDLASGAPGCKTGSQQSPIDLETVKAMDVPTPFTLDYQGGAFEFVNNGHTIQANALQEINTLNHGGQLYTLRQFHFHASSEHAIDGARFPMELHFVHQNAANKLAVLGVLIQEGKENAALAEAFEALPQNEKARGKRLDVDIIALLPEQKNAFEYTGSLTTPPCSENVCWLVLRAPIEFSRTQIDAFRKLYPNNSRPLQAINGRAIGKSRGIARPCF